WRCGGGGRDERRGADEQILPPRWVFPAPSPPLACGTVTVRGNRIVAVSQAGERSADVDFGNAAIIPGLVNAHTHLDLTGLRGLVPPGTDFVGWLGDVVGQRRTQSPERVPAGIPTGLDHG